MSAYFNGDSPVTRAELAAHLEPIKQDIQAISEDVKHLIRYQAAVSAIAQDKTTTWATRGAKGSVFYLIVAALALVLSAVALAIPHT